MNEWNNKTIKYQTSKEVNQSMYEEVKIIHHKMQEKEWNYTQKTIYMYVSIYIHIYIENKNNRTNTEIYDLNNQWNKSINQT